MTPQDVYIIYFLRFKKIVNGTATFVQELSWKQVVFIHRETMTLWKWVFVDRVVGDFEHEIIYGSSNKDTLVGYFGLTQKGILICE